MGMTYIQSKIANPAAVQKKKTVKFLVDSGAVYTVVPRSVLAQLKIRPHSKKIFTLANGDVVEREVSDAIFEYRGQRAASPVIFGEKGDSNLLGAVTLESLGFILDPLQRELKALPMNLVGLR